MTVRRGDVGFRANGHVSVLVAAGALLVLLAYPPFHLFLPAFICLVPAVWLVLGATAQVRFVRPCLARGFGFGLLSNALLLYWMAVALWRYRPVSIVAYLVAVVVLATYMAGFFLLVGWVSRTTRCPVILTFPVFWTAMEWSIAHQGPWAFPWLGLGTSLTSFPATVQIADVVGARGVTFLLAMANVALALAWLRRREPRRAALLVGGVTAGLVAALGYGVVRTHTLEIRRLGTIALIQPNTRFDQKWNPTLQDSIMARLLRLSFAATNAVRPDLVAWPETAVPGDFDHRPDWDRSISDHARTAGIPVLVGGLDLEGGEAGSYQTHNAAFLFDGSGQRVGVPYHKRHPVALVERSIFDSGLTRGPQVAAPLFRIPMGTFGVLICYESTFESIAREYRRNGAGFVTNISNDDWFRGTSGPGQHAAHLVMRAIENRMGIARVANSGVSELIDPFGRTYLQTAPGRRTFVSGNLLTTDVMTVYTRLGDWVGGLALAGALLLTVAAASSRRAPYRGEVSPVAQLPPSAL